MANKLTDNELWDAVVSDNSRAFVVLYNRYWRKLYKTASYYLKDAAAAEEITHDVFVELWQKRKSVNILNFQSYIRAASRYHVYKQLKAARVNIVEYIDQFTDKDDLAVFNDSVGKLNYEDLETKLSAVLQQLPPRCRQIFWLSRVQNLSNDEIAQKFNISKRTVENQITAALKLLRTEYPHFSGAAILLMVILIS
ncbi:RNA polymerase sigma-70 factor [Mucilaginibacter sp. FT3.2]|uniref:RNA polymerase sigma-70 factor n=1 Tax=Mucilaginibacter sp. FT3.2 TaxID=2723090 RepID=UPI00161EE4DC|nr:RNA polymerase sigma-70 factor [Mucilaginibacter sp. FT3.2]MBB6234417.1 RNA polymerase sigma-70 factor (ECF subfamily) [Mucilaginibacter sp. FT3.2]